MEEKLATLRIATWIVIGMLIGAIFPIWPYGYYQLLRLAVTGTAIYAVTILQKNHPTPVVILALIGLIFNPILPLSLPRAFWFPLDLATALLFFVFAKKIFVLKKTKALENKK